MLNNFQKMNVTTRSIYDLEDLEVLIILKDGCNITSWDDVSDKKEILFINEDLSNQTDLKGKYSGLNSLKAIITSNLTDKVTSTESMFEGCFALSNIQTRDWDVSNVLKMNGMFCECNNLNDLSFASNWNVSNVREMSGMFEACYSLGDISPLADWDVGNVTDFSFMFCDCHSLENIHALSNWDVGNVKNLSGMFSFCNYLNNLSPLSDWNVSNVEIIEFMFEGCDYLNDASTLSNWKINNADKKDNIFKDCELVKKPAWY